MLTASILVLYCPTHSSCSNGDTRSVCDRDQTLPHFAVLKFLTRDTIQLARHMARCPSVAVCHSKVLYWHGWTSCNQRRMVSYRLWVSDARHLGKIPMESPLRGRPFHVGYEKFVIFD